jgi:hypothetical protein
LLQESAKKAQIERKKTARSIPSEQYLGCFCQVRPDLVFGASTGSDSGDGFGRAEERGFVELGAVAEVGGDVFNVGFDKTHGTDEDGTACVDEHEGGNHREAIGVRDDIAFFFGIEDDGERDAVLLDEFCGFFWAILPNANDREVGRLVALVKALEKRESELADGAADFEEGEENATFLQGRRERKFFTVDGFEREIWSEIARNDVSHLLLSSEATEDATPKGHTNILTQRARAATRNWMPCAAGSNDRDAAG